MNNYINSRVEGFNNTKIQGMYEHALRIVNSRNQKNNNTNYCYDVESNKMLKVVYISRKDLKLLPESEQIQYKQNRKMLLNYFHNKIDNYAIDRVEHNQLFKARRKKNLQDDCGSHAEGVLTFSEQIREDYDNGKLDVNLFMERGIAAAEESVKYLNGGNNGKLINVTLHLDEKTPHFHYTFKNYDENGRSLTHNANIKKKGLKLEDLQDIATKHFKKDFGIERGISKEVKGDTRHQKTSEYYEKLLKQKDNEVKELKQHVENQNEIIKDQKFTIENQSSLIASQFEVIEDNKTTIDNLIALKNDYLLEIETYKTQVDDLKLERKNVTNSMEEDKKALYDEISMKQKELRVLKTITRNSIKEVDKVIDMLHNNEMTIEDLRDLSLVENEDIANIALEKLNEAKEEELDEFDTDEQLSEVMENLDIEVSTKKSKKKYK